MSSIGKDQTERKNGFPRSDERGVLGEGLCQRSEGVGSVHGVVAALVGRLVLCHGECEQTRTNTLKYMRGHITAPDIWRYLKSATTF